MSHRFEDESEIDGEGIAWILNHLKQDQVFSSIRDAEPLRGATPELRDQCARLWEEVEELIDRLK
jgi:hypothetical protein